MSRNARVWVGGLPHDISEKELTKVFAKFGSLESVNCRCAGKGPPFAFLQYQNSEDAQDAIHTMNQSRHFGGPVKVQLEKEGDRRGKGSYGGRDGGGRERSRRRGRRDSRDRRRETRRDRDRGSRSRRRHQYNSPPRRHTRRSEPERRSSPENSRSTRDNNNNRTSDHPSSKESGNNRDRRSGNHSSSNSIVDVNGQIYDLNNGLPKITLENLPTDMIWSELRELGKKFVETERDVTFARTFRDEKGIGCGMLEFTREEHADLVIKKLNNKRIKGHDVRLVVYRKQGCAKDTK